MDHRWFESLGKRIRSGIAVGRVLRATRHVLASCASYRMLSTLLELDDHRLISIPIRKPHVIALFRRPSLTLGITTFF